MVHYHLFSYIFHWVVVADLTSMSMQLGKQYHIINRFSDTLLPFGEGDRIFKVLPHDAHNDFTEGHNPMGWLSPT